jgi:hypothetical protein
MSARVAKLLSHKLNHELTNDVTRKELTREYDSVMQDTFNMDKELSNNFRELMQVEADLLANLSQVSRYFSSAAKDRLSSLLRPLIDRSNTPVQLYDYMAIENDRIMAIRDRLPKELTARHVEMDKECNSAMDELLKLL